MSRTITLRVDGRDFTVEAMSPEKALRVVQLSLSMVLEYQVMLKEAGNAYLVAAEYADRWLDVLLGAMKFRGASPDWLQRSWIKGRVKNAPVQDKLDFVEDLANGYSAALLALTAD